jgi:hypothetical protein
LTAFGHNVGSPSSIVLQDKGIFFGRTIKDDDPTISGTGYFFLLPFVVEAKIAL